MVGVRRTASGPVPLQPGDLAGAYDLCERITREQARNFYYGIRLLARDRRQMLCAVYALARRVDDIGDGDLPVEAKAAALQQLRGQLAEAAHGVAPEQDPVLRAVTDAAGRLPIPLGAFEELLNGVQMDVEGRRYETFDELVEYCRCVAGAIGRLCLGVFGSRPDPRAPGYADALGVALQQTNILRDIREDLLNGRVYLPQRELDAFGVQLRVGDDGRLVDDDGGLAALIRAACRRARDWYADGMLLFPLLDRRSGASAAAMAGIYARLLDLIEADPAIVYDRRQSLSGWQKAGVAARALSGRAA
jgi:phytoene synthase